MNLDYPIFKDKLEDFYYNKRLQENIEYRNKHGKGPYEYNGSFADRVVPYFDAGYWVEYHSWLEKTLTQQLTTMSLHFRQKNLH
jgi:hypothetical protein